MAQAVARMRPARQAPAADPIGCKGSCGREFSDPNLSTGELFYPKKHYFGLKATPRSVRASSRNSS